MNVRRSTTQSGTEPMTSDASPVGTCRSAMKRSPFALGSSAPTSTQDASSRGAMRSTCRPRRHAVKPNIRSAAATKRVPTANIGGIVSPASSIPRYVDPQMM